MDPIVAFGLSDITDITSDWDAVSSMALDEQPSLCADSSTTSSKSDRGFSPGAVLTPPDSNASSPIENNKVEGNACISVSTTFFPSANIDTLPTDIIILASDSVFFYVSSERLLSASSNNFNGRLPVKGDTIDAEPIISLPESSAVLNIVLHTAYNMSCLHYAPSLADLEAAVSSMKLYGLHPQKFIVPNTPLFLTLLTYAPISPLDLYALSASNDLHDLAVTTSSHLLSFQLPTLTDALAEKIGPIYLKKLFFLHLGRTDALKRLILTPPHPHAPTPHCDFTEQKKITRAWALASAYLTWDARPDLSVSSLESALNPLADHLTCDECRKTLRDRIRDVVIQWAQVKPTI
ncbi:hypothetical protein PNOK_0402600 [Pyrrhoderma noxium]|uniref:BTB domain-containing protein n=1 Tax=Pyrrhoderma noxium TaxID=2282107 RepID=A0A286UPD2_9AGAM|nr:hypothetical protein PNOK_0402600 [Pyrrhoderma noxium]